MPTIATAAVFGMGLLKSARKTDSLRRPDDSCSSYVWRGACAAFALLKSARKTDSLRRSACAAFALLTLAQMAGAATHAVGPGKSFERPCQALTKASAGDTIEIDAAGDYLGDTCTFGANGLTIRGINGRPVMSAKGRPVSQDKGIWVVTGNDTTVENIEFTAATSSAGNGAGIRQEGANLTVRNSYFHHNQMGILSGVSPLSTIVVEHSEFAYNGANNGQSHNIYVGEIARFIFRYNHSHHSMGGQAVKTRAIHNYILYNQIGDYDGKGTSNWEVDIPNGGQTFLIGNIIRQAEGTTNSNVLDYTGEGLGGPHTNYSRLYVVNNTFINDVEQGVNLLVFPVAPFPAYIKNNLFVGKAPITSQATAILEDNLFVTPDAFVDFDAYDLRLKPDHPAAHAGADPGIRSGFPLLPDKEYASGQCYSRRTDPDGAIALGALGAAGGEKVCASGPSQVSLRINGGPAMLRPGRDHQFSAQTGGGSAGVRWVVDAIGDGGSIDENGLYRSPDELASYRVITVGAVSVDDPTVRAFAEITLLPSALSPMVIRVNAGGGAEQDASGFWSPDFGYTGGSPSLTDPRLVAATSAPGLYRSRRYGQKFQYQFAVPNGAYRARLRFADWAVRGPGQRIMRILINGETVISDFDAAASAGSPGLDFDLSFPVTVTKENLVLQFEGLRDAGIVNAIEVAPDSGISLAIDPTEASLLSSQTLRFRAVLKGTSNENVRWQVSPQIGSIAADGTYTPPADLKVYTNVRISATPEADPSLIARAAVRLTPAVEGRSVLKVNTGGGPARDNAGGQWSGDTGCAGGFLHWSGNILTGTHAPQVVASARVADGAVRCSYQVPNGNYLVILHFAEPDSKAAGGRVVDVRINGSVRERNLDPVAWAGSPWAPLARHYPLTVTAGKIDIDVEARRDRAILNGIEILPVPSAAVSLSPALTSLAAGETVRLVPSTGDATDYSWLIEPDVGKISADGLYSAPSSHAKEYKVTVTARRNDHPGAVATATVTVRKPDGPLPVRLNVGGGAYTDSQGAVWEGDALAEPSGTAPSVGGTIQGTDDSVLYQTMRATTQTFDWTFRVPDGDYRVTLKFAEPSLYKGGDRTFHIDVAGQRVLSDLDVPGETNGARVALDKRFDVTVRGGRLNIKLTTAKLAVIINAIEILPAALIPRAALWPAAVAGGAAVIGLLSVARARRARHGLPLYW